eukprot:2666667-Amphidinium_carterae.1
MGCDQMPEHSSGTMLASKAREPLLDCRAAGIPSTISASNHKASWLKIPINPHPAANHCSLNAKRSAILCSVASYRNTCHARTCPTNPKET